VSLFKQYREFVVPKKRDGVFDYSAPAMKAQYEELKQYQQRLASMDIGAWPVSAQVDYHIVRAEMNGLAFNHRVIRPWTRDPGFYCTTPRFEETMRGAVHVPRLPIPAEKLDAVRTGIQNLPAMLAQAKKNLTETAADFGALALRMKERERESWGKFARKAAEHHPELVPDVEAVVAAVDDFIAWLKANEGGFLPNAGVGEDNWNWFMKNVYLFPYTWEEAHAIVQRELERSEAFMRLEEHHNREVPELLPAASLEETKQRHDDGMDRLMSFLESAQIFKDMEYLHPKPGGNTY
jgi:hypothetical protein